MSEMKYNVLKPDLKVVSCKTKDPIKALKEIQNTTFNLSI